MDFSHIVRAISTESRFDYNGNFEGTRKTWNSLQEHPGPRASRI